jgi:hypothetical protein
VTTPIRSIEKTFPDVGGGFVEPHHRGDGIDWSEAYPYKGTETTQASGAGGGPSGAGGELERGSSGAHVELERGELGGSPGATRRSPGGI